MTAPICAIHETFKAPSDQGWVCLNCTCETAMRNMWQDEEADVNDAKPAARHGTGGIGPGLWDAYRLTIVQELEARARVRQAGSIIATVILMTERNASFEEVRTAILKML